MRKNKNFLNFLFFLIVSMCLPNLASAISITVTYDPTVLDDQSGFVNDHSTTPLDHSPVAIKAGDQVDLTVNFSHGLRLRMFDFGPMEVFNGWIHKDSTGVSGAFSISDVAIDFLGLEGSLNAPLTMAPDSSSNSHLGPSFMSDFIAAGESIAFTGYHVSYRVDSLPTPAGSDSNYYGNLHFSALAGDFQVEAAPAPEPATLLLFGIGLAGLAGFGRRKIIKR